MKERQQKLRAKSGRAIASGLLASLLSVFAAAPAHATEFVQNWLSVRAAGMGNAYSAVVSDGDALFYNPAALSRVKGVNWTIFDVHAGANGADSLALLQDTVANFSKQPQATVSKLYGKKIWAEGGAKSAFYLPYFAVAGFASTEAGFSAENSANPSLTTNYFFDYGVAVGSSLDVIPSVFSLGFAARRVNRTGTTLPLTADQLANMNQSQLEAEFKRRGTGYGLDLGALIRVPGPISPALSFVYRDLGYTSFSFEEGAGAPPRIEPEMLAGASLMISVPLLSITPSIEYRYITRNDLLLTDRLSIGVEVGIPFIDIRAGLNQGYYTAGLGLNLGLLKVDVATYGVELGAYPGQREDRRYMAQATFELGFDPSIFSFGGSNGGKDADGKPTERRRLKQRR